MKQQGDVCGQPTRRVCPSCGQPCIFDHSDTAKEMARRNKGIVNIQVLDHRHGHIVAYNPPEVHKWETKP